MLLEKQINYFNDDISKKIYHYSAFGIRIDSEILLPELSVSAEGVVADIIIRYGDLATPLYECGNFKDRAVGNFVLKIEELPAFCLMNGKQIIVQLFQDSTVMRANLLGTIMGALLMQRKMLPLHGSTVVINGNGIIFTGESGAGKSTIAAALRKQGYPLMSDDLSAMSCEQNCVFYGQPGYMEQRLSEDTTEMLGIDTIGLEKVYEFRNKYVVPVLDESKIVPVPIGAIYEIVKAPCADIVIEKLQGIDKLTTIMNNTYQPLLVEALNIKDIHLKQCSNLAKQISVFRLSRPEGKRSIGQQVEAILQNENICNNK